MKTQTQSNEQLTLTIGGMACSGCANTVQNTLSDLEGVQKATVNLDDESASVTYDADIISSDDFKKAIEDAGYEFKGIN